jgi:hypothetical protein
MQRRLRAKGWALRYSVLGSCFPALRGHRPRMSDDNGVAKLIIGIVLGVGVGAIVLVAAIFFDVFPLLPYGR